MLKLVVLDGPMRGHEFLLRQSPAVIGRDAGVDVSLALDPHIAPFHCQIREERGQHWLEDLGSSRGTRIYGKPYDRQMPLFSRDMLRVGETRLIVLDASAPADEVQQLLSRHSPAREPAGREAGAAADARAPAPPEAAAKHLATADPAAMLAQVQAGDPPEVQRVVNRLRVLQEVTADLAGLVDLRAILERVIARILRLVGAERAMAVTVSEAGEIELPPLVVGYQDRSRAATGAVVPSQTVIARAIRDRLAVIVGNMHAELKLEPSQSLLLSAYRSVLCVPILRKDDLFALIYLDSTELDAFSREELEMVMVIANQAAAAAANARLYEELRRAYGELETAHDQLVQTEKLATIGGLAASISHDIGNVITPITGVAALVMRSDAVPAPLKEAFDRQMQRLRALASQLLSFSSPKPPALVPVNLNQVANDSLLLVRTEASHHQVQVDLRLAADLPPVAADPNRLDQAAVNIMLNAVQAMQATGGRLTVASGVGPGEDRVFLSFTDTGPGISEAHLALLGRPFFTTKGRSGNGLGVYGTKRIVEEEHGGVLRIQSRVGEGSTFTIDLPRLQVAAG